MSKYVLHESYNMGFTYYITGWSDTIEPLQQQTSSFKDNRRWVIASEEGVPLEWCETLKNLMRPAFVDDVAVATDDKFARKILQDSGKQTFTTAELYKSVTGKDLPERTPTPEEIQAGMKKLKEFIDSGEIPLWKEK